MCCLKPCGCANQLSHLLAYTFLHSISRICCDGQGWSVHCMRNDECIFSSSTHFSKWSFTVINIMPFPPLQNQMGNWRYIWLSLWSVARVIPHWLILPYARRVNCHDSSDGFSWFPWSHTCRKLNFKTGFLVLEMNRLLYRVYYTTVNTQNSLPAVLVQQRRARHAAMNAELHQSHIPRRKLWS